ncbi:MAG: hypothetical protein WDN50_25475 [Bradyrhizobium sp.]
MARPEGYRKAVRLMEMADRFGIPVLSIVDSRRRLSRHPARGTRPGRSHRALDRCLPVARRPPMSRSLPARACPAAPSRSRPPTAC